MSNETEKNEEWEKVQRSVLVEIFRDRLTMNDIKEYGYFLIESKATEEQRAAHRNAVASIRPDDLEAYDIAIEAYMITCDAMRGWENREN